MVLPQGRREKAQKQTHRSHVNHRAPAFQLRKMRVPRCRKTSFYTPRRESPFRTVVCAGDQDLATLVSRFYSCTSFLRAGFDGAEKISKLAGRVLIQQSQRGWPSQQLAKPTGEASNHYTRQEQNHSTLLLLGMITWPYPCS